MDHTMGFCPNKKQEFPFFTDSLTLFRTSQNPTTLFTKQIEIQRPCEPEFTKMQMNHRNSKVRSMLTTHPSYKGMGAFQPPIPQFNPRYVSGILGSKSLCHTGFGHLTWDMLISDFLNEIRSYRNSSCDTTVCEKEQSFSSSPLEQNTHFSTTTSPPKKKFAKEDSNIERRGNSPILSEESTTPGNCTQKQSYAEVAKATVPSTNHSQTGSESYLKGTIPQSLQPRRSHSGQHSGKLTHQSYRSSSGRRGTKNSQVKDSCANSTVVSDNLGGAEVKTDRRSHNQTQTTQRNGGRHSFQRRWRKNIERNKNPCGSKTGRVAVKHSSSESYPKTYPMCEERGSAPFRSNKRYCDIEMVNWRTGEPIFKMGVEVESGNVACVPKKLAEPIGHESRHCEGELGIVGCVSDRERKCSESGSSISSGSELQLPSATTRRRSYSSECSVDSEDSFIVFQTAYSDSLSDLTGDWSDCSSVESYDSDSDRGSEFDSCDGNGCSPSSSQVLREINSRWHREHEDISTQPKTGEQENISSKRMKVQFSPSKPKVHRMVAWEYAYRQARIGPWEQNYRDRLRFQERIKRTESVLAPILSSQHRARIWNTLHS